MIIDATKDAVQNVLNLVNLANQAAFAASNISLVEGGPVTVGVPSVATGPNGENTQVTLTGDPSVNFSGSINVFYNRRALNENVSMPPVKWKIDKTVTPAAFMSTVLAKLNLIAAEVQPITSIPVNAPSVQLSPIANSLVYAGVITLNLAWPPLAPHDFILDNMNGTGLLSGRPGDSGVMWKDNGAYSATLNAQLNGTGMLTTSAGSTAGGKSGTVTVPSEHVAILNFYPAVAPNPSDTNFGTTITFAGGGSLSGYSVTAQLVNNGTLNLSLTRSKGGVSTTVSTTKTWGLGTHVLSVTVSQNDTILKYDNAQVLETPGGIYIDSSSWGFTIDNGNEAAAVNVDKVEVKSIVGMDTVPQDLWAQTPINQQTYSDFNGVDRFAKQFTQTTNAGVYNGSIIWTCNNQIIRGVNCETGAIVQSLDIRTAIPNNLGAGYKLMFIDVNGIMWLWGSFYSSTLNANQQSLLRYDTKTNTIKDNLFVNDGIVSSMGMFRLASYRPGDAVVWFFQLVPGGQPGHLVSLDINTGAIVTTSPLSIYANGITWMERDTVNNILWVSDSNSNSVYRTLGLDLNNNTNVLFTLNSFQPFKSVFVPATGEMIVMDYLTNPTAFRLSKINSQAGTIGTQVTYTSSSTPTSISTVLGGRMAYNPATDEIMFVLQSSQTAVLDGTELWAFKRSDLTFSRVVIASVPGRTLYDFGLDAAGNVYAEFITDVGANYTTILARELLA
jgi:hypothetical protein